MSLLIGTIGVVQSLSNWLASRRKEMAIFSLFGDVERGDAANICDGSSATWNWAGRYLELGFPMLEC